MPNINDWREVKLLSSYSMCKAALRKHAPEIKAAKPDTYGYALMTGGEDFVSYQACVVTSTTSFVRKYRWQGFLNWFYLNEVRYRPDEWPDWHDALAEYNEHLSEVLEELDHLHKHSGEAFDLDATKTRFLSDLNTEVYLKSMQELKAEGVFDGFSYLVIYMSDSDHPIVSRSLKALNDEKTCRRATPWVVADDDR